MKKLSFLILVLLSNFLFANEIEETLAEIKALRKEIAQNKVLLEKKINDLKKTNPLFADRDPFESDAEYIARQSKAQEQINRLRKQMLGDLETKLKILSNRLFETNKIEIDLDPKKYNPNTEEWDITVRHLEYQKEAKNVTIKIPHKEAKLLYKNWNIVKKTGLLAIGIGDKIVLAKLFLENPLNGYKFEYVFNPNIIVSVSDRYSNTNIQSIDYSPDGNYLAVGSRYYAEIYNVSKNEKVFSSKRYSYRLRSIDYSPNGRFLVVGYTVMYSGNVEIYNVSTKEIIFSEKYNSTVNSVNFSPNSKYFAIGTQGGCVEIYNISTKEKIFSKEYDKNVNSVNFSSDGKYLAIASYNYTEIFNIARKEEIFSKSVGAVSIDFNPDGNYLAVGICCNAEIYNVSTKEKVFSERYNNKVKAVKFSPDGKFLAVSSGKNVYINLTLLQSEEETIKNKFISSPPQLVASVSFKDNSGNNYLEALEKGEIQVKITNKGKGPAKGITVKLTPSRTKGLNYNSAYIDEIPAGKTVIAKIPIEAYIDCPDSSYVFKINFDEINGFPPQPVELQFSTKSYRKPELYIADVGIEDDNQNGIIEPGEVIRLTVRVANKGKGYASGAYAKFYSGDNVFITDAYPKVVSLGDLEVNQHKDIPIEFFVNSKCPDKIPLYVDFTEATGIAGSEHIRVPITKSERIGKIKRVVISGINKNYDGNLEDLSIDVEKNIPVSPIKNNNALVVIFGIENYKNVSNVNYAYRDAVFMKKYFTTTFGIPEERIYFRANNDVTLGEFNKIFAPNGWLDKRVIENQTDVYFYYAGHGAPAIKEKKPYLIPYDGDPNYPQQTGYPLEKIFNNLNKLNAKSVTVFLDACFSGANRENETLLADARPISIQLKNNYVGDITLFSATSSNEISSSYPKKRHGLFTYFLMKGLQGNADANNDKKLTVAELYSYVKENVSLTAGKLDREQTPQLRTLKPNKILVQYDEK